MIKLEELMEFFLLCKEEMHIPLYLKFDQLFILIDNF